MKSNKRFLSIILVIFLTILMGWAVVRLAYLPKNILHQLSIKDVKKIEMAFEVAQPTYWLLGVAAVLSCGLIVLLINMSFSGDIETIVYVDKFQKDQKEAETHATVSYNDHAKLQFDLVQSMFQNAGLSAQNRITQAVYKISSFVQAGTAALYVAHTYQTPRFLRFNTGYAFTIPDSENLDIEFGEGLVGQSAKSSAEIFIENIANGYSRIFSGLGSASPRFLYLFPVKNHLGQVVGVLEVATFAKPEDFHLEFVRNTLPLLAGGIESLEVKPQQDSQQYLA